MMRLLRIPYYINLLQQLNNPQNQPIECLRLRA